MPDTSTKYDKTEDLVGKHFGHFKVIRFASYKVEDNKSARRRAHWLVRCTPCKREHVLSIRNLKGKKVFRSGQWKEIPHKVFLCECDKERKLFHKVHKKLKLAIPFELFLHMCNQPCGYCSVCNSYSLEENEVTIRYNHIIEGEESFEVVCSEHK